MRLAALGAVLLTLAGPAIGAGGINATAQPVQGSAQRKALLDALRPAIQAELGPKIVFAIEALRVENGWAFVVADPRRQGGGAVNAKAYLPDWELRKGIEVTAVLRFRQGRWMLVRHAVGASDVWYCDIGPRAMKRGYGC